MRKRKKREFHGGTGTPMYDRWRNMRARCDNPKHDEYHNYGGRGIIVCKEWHESFKTFLFDMWLPPFKGAQLNRIDNDGPYCKSNCRWATQKEQMRNTRRNHLYTIDGVTKTRIEWCEEYGRNYSTFRWRMRNGWELIDALTRPPLPIGGNITPRK
jgi:hypothetical protein